MKRPKERLIVRISQFMYTRLYNTYKYKKLIKSPFFLAIAYPLYSLFNFYYFHRVLNFYQKKIEELKDSQIMILGRRDFGTHLWGLHYLRLWRQVHGKAHLLVFTNENAHIKQLAKILSPEAEVIYPDHFFDHLVAIVFGHQFVFSYTLLRVYAHLATHRPDFLHIWDLAESPYVRYNAHLDPFLSSKSVLGNNFSNENGMIVEGILKGVRQPVSEGDTSEERHLKAPEKGPFSWEKNSKTDSNNYLQKEFIQAYTYLRAQFDYRWDTFVDVFKLNYSIATPKIKTGFILEELRKSLPIKQPYAILNVNTKEYPGPSSRRTIYHPERYDSLIDRMIEKGYCVVLHGRREQPHFRAREGLVHYATSPFCSIENDLALYSDCEFAIISKTGAELFVTLANIPALGLNYIELVSMQPAKKIRFFPKHLKDRESGKILTWKEGIQSAAFFNIGQNNYGNPADYVELEEEELLAALEEFLPLVSLPEKEWLNYSDSQKEFKATLTPFHLDLFLTHAVPCESYLTGNRIYS